MVNRQIVSMSSTTSSSDQKKPTSTSPGAASVEFNRNSTSPVALSHIDTGNNAKINSATPTYQRSASSIYNLIHSTSKDYTHTNKPILPSLSSNFNNNNNNNNLNRSHSSILPYTNNNITHHTTFPIISNAQRSIPKLEETDSPPKENIIPSTARRNTQEQLAKQIAEKHVDKPIADYAKIVKDAELKVMNIDPNSNPKSTLQSAEQDREKQRQIYALIWLMKNCQSKHDSYVPRGRIFAQYAASCAQNSLKPLSQASLGKLIRTVFPDLTTRRLGMRGQSKYHYCGLRLMDDTSDNVGINPINDSKLNDKKINTKNFDDQTYEQEPVMKKIKLEDAMDDKLQKIQKTDDLTKELPFLENLFNEIFNNKQTLNDDYQLDLPRIDIEKLPSSIDKDIISSLESLYFIHCNTIFQNVKFFKFDYLSTNNLFLFHPNGLISPQMYNLFISEELYDWIHKCDLITHISIIKFLSNFIINFNRENELIISKLESFIHAYQDQILKSTIDLPVPILTSKLQISKNFTTIIKKLLKLLKFIVRFISSFESFKDGMKKDWEQIVNLDDILEMVTTEKNSEVLMKIKEFVKQNTLTLLNNDSFSLVDIIINTLNFISNSRNFMAQTMIDSYVRFTNTLIGDISLKNSENLLPWLFFNNVTVQLINYSFEITKFVNEIE
ncbi:hypothetical protein KAFR_0I02180 [Kazachstania africana CBS 2517]|uniref:RFX-type winged-helix domain-containing protein n=1 Tax=Kazachstania africana (strain ATCC 22294 / BCRC 22015 / CBS 2517 / CECT 1963 / NBRC 1671 / NRRL Y-8276) TaxID=1071382 RepID=H2B047_KAZAF|nr:hypothetical protein KAFR_0I02180 [Kazachstania africana CBS 2517]CCF59997.1 hypothetical protein KAFR_0I02180 [Kazachstania africana CBS 2517]